MKVKIFDIVIIFTLIFMIPAIEAYFVPSPYRPVTASVLQELIADDEDDVLGDISINTIAGPLANNKRYQESRSKGAFCYLATEAMTYKRDYFVSPSNTCTKDMTVVNNDALGLAWEHIYEYNANVDPSLFDLLGFDYGWDLWRNTEAPNMYCIAFAGTDSFADFKEYIPMMTNEDYSEHQKLVREDLSKLNAKIKELRPSFPIKQLWITGYSLGGFLASFAMSEIIDAEVAYNNGTTDTSKSLQSLRLSKIFPDIESWDHIRACTFAAPPLYCKATDLHSLAPILSEIDILNLKVENGKVPLPGWAKEKWKNHKNKEYDKYIYNFINDRCPVSNLDDTLAIPGHFKHLGRLKQYKAPEAKRSDIAALDLALHLGGSLTGQAMALVNSIKNKDFSIDNLENGATSGSEVAKRYNLFYHLPSILLQVMEPEYALVKPEYE